MEKLKDANVILSIDPGIKNYGILIVNRVENKILLAKVVNLLKDDNQNIFNTLSEELIWLKDKNYLNNVDLVIIEKQPKISEKLIRIEQHTIAFFYFSLSKSIITISPRRKYKLLGIQSKKDIKYYIEENLSNYDISVLNRFRSKKIHLFDCLSQIKAFEILSSASM